MNDTTLQADNHYRDGAEAASPRSAAAVNPVPLYNARDPRRKSLFITVLLSFMPGLGHTYVGYYQRGFIHFLIFGSTIALVHSGQMNGLIPLLGTFLPFFWFFNQIDAVRRATFYNLALDGMQDMPLPDEMSGPLMGGSYMAGTVMVIGGVVALSSTLFNLPLDWLEDWWPMAPIAFGAYLIYRARMDQTESERTERSE